MQTSHHEDNRRYTEEDTERVREAEHSSAGVPTRSLPTWMPQQPADTGETSPTPASASDSRTDIIALALIVIGVMALLGQFWPGRGEITGGMVLLTIASCFLFFAFWQRIYGLLIPGSILAGLSVGVTFAGVTSGVSVLWGLSLGFLAILFLGRVWFHVDEDWPIYPAIPLFAVGLINAMSNLPGIFANGLIVLPFLLIGAGLYLGWQKQHSG